MIPAAFAENSDADSDNERFAGKSWDEVVDDFLEMRKLDGETIALGYYNFTTGEEHFYNGDRYIVAGSMYKIPLNMIYAEKIAAGEMDLNTTIGGYRYSELLKSTIVNSNNDMAKIMWDNLGSYHNYRRLIAPYCGEDPDTVDEKFYENNFFTSRQIISCLKLLYTEQDRFPNIIDTLLTAEPHKYFRRDENRFQIAHKYGYYDDKSHFYLNDCALIWTDDPIAIVMFTDNANNPYGALATFCTVMCDYTQYQVRMREEAAEQAAAEQQAIIDSAAFNTAQQQAKEALGIADNGRSTGRTALILVVICSSVGIIMATALVSVILLRERRYKLPASAAAVILGIIVLIAVYSHDTKIIHPKSDPQDAVSGFFDALSAARYDKVDQYISNYSSVGLAPSGTDQYSAALYSALQNSYDYELMGNCLVNGSDAVQTVRFTYLDTAKLQNAVTGISAQFEEKEPDALFSAAIEAEDCRSYSIMNIYLTYLDNAWHITADEALLSCICGGADVRH